jgi:hypothetical protein
MFEIESFYTKNIESFPSLKAEFTVKFKALQLNKFRLMQNQKGELYVAEPTDKPYENKDGKKIYPKFYFLAQGLKEQIAEKAIAKLHEGDVQTANNVFDPDGEIPF